MGLKVSNAIVLSNSASISRMKNCNSILISMSSKWSRKSTPKKRLLGVT
jgi:hypothetical protein